MRLEPDGLRVSVHPKRNQRVDIRRAASWDERSGNPGYREHQQRPSVDTNIAEVMKNGLLCDAATLNETYPRQKALDPQWWWKLEPPVAPASKRSGSWRALATSTASRPSAEPTRRGGHGRGSPQPP